MYQKRYNSINKSYDKSSGPIVDEKRIYNYAIKLLTGRDFSELKLKEKLKLKNFDKAIVEKVIAEIKERGFLREESYLEARIKAFMHKGYAKKYILQKLTSESDKIDMDQIDEVFLEYGIQENDQVLKLISKKQPQLIPTDFEEKKKTFQKILHFVVSKGHSPGLAFQMIKQSFKNQSLEMESLEE